jgi:hypothetical protein
LHRTVVRFLPGLTLRRRQGRFPLKRLKTDGVDILLGDAREGSEGEGEYKAPGADMVGQDIDDATLLDLAR